MIWIKAWGWLLAVAVLLSSVAHFQIGRPQLQAQLRQHGVTETSELWVDATAGWSFGSLAMLVFGLMLTACVFRLRSDRRKVWPFCLVGAAYVAFGAASLIAFGFSPHFMGFLVFGFLMVAWATTAAFLTKRIAAD